MWKGLYPSSDIHVPTTTKRWARAERSEGNHTGRKTRFWEIHMEKEQSLLKDV
jgi:hypothetical protein